MTIILSNLNRSKKKFTGRFLSTVYFITERESEFFFKSVNRPIWQSYKQERGCLIHFARLANTLLKDEESARDNHVLACSFAKYLPI